jgi:hypothetical protein
MLIIFLMNPRRVSNSAGSVALRFGSTMCIAWESEYMQYFLWYGTEDGSEDHLGVWRTLYIIVLHNITPTYK